MHPHVQFKSSYRFLTPSAHWLLTSYIINLEVYLWTFADRLLFVAGASSGQGTRWRGCTRTSASSPCTSLVQTIGFKKQIIPA